MPRGMNTEVCICGHGRHFHVLGGPCHAPMHGGSPDPLTTCACTGFLSENGRGIETTTPALPLGRKETTKGDTQYPHPFVD